MNEMKVVNFRNVAYVSLTIIVMLLVTVAYIVIGEISKSMPGEIGFVFGVMVSVFACLMMYIYVGIFKLAELCRENALEEAIISEESDRDEEKEEEFEE